MTTITDTFTRADNAASLGNTDTGQAWTADFGTWGVKTHRAYTAASTPAGPGHGIGAVATVPLGSSTQDVRVDLEALPSANGDNGLVARANGPNDLWFAFINESGGDAFLYAGKLVGGVISYVLVNNVLVSAVPTPWSLRLTLDAANTVRVYLNGTQYGPSLVDNFNAGETRCGLLSDTSTANVLDNFVAYDAVQPPPQPSVTFGEDYPDFTRLSQYTAAPEINVTATATSTESILGQFYTGGFESLIVRTSAQQAAVGWVYTFKWFADVGFAVELGRLDLRTISAVPITAQVPNRGPWCQVSVATTALAAHAFTMVVTPRTGTPSGVGAFLDGLIHGGASVSIAATTTLIQNAFGLTPGEASLTVQTSAANWSAVILGLDELSAAVGAFGGMSSSGGVSQTQRVILPPYWTQIVIRNNDAGPQTFNFAVQAAL